MLARLVKKDEDVIEASLETFRKHLRLQKNVKEIKFKTLFSKASCII